MHEWFHQTRNYIIAYLTLSIVTLVYDVARNWQPEELLKESVTIHGNANKLRYI